MIGKRLFLNVGTPSPLAHLGKEMPSSFVKAAVSSPLWLNRVRLAGDEQADLNNHGGPDKAVRVFHRSTTAIGLHACAVVAALGEDFTAEELLKDHVCIGDVYGVGGATVQVSQPRMVWPNAFHPAKRGGIRSSGVTSDAPSVALAEVGVVQLLIVWKAQGFGWHLTTLISTLKVGVQEVFRAWSARWSLEVSHRLRKQSLALGSCQCLTYAAHL